jgi:uncharacterized membrane protein
MLFTTDCP